MRRIPLIMGAALAVCVTAAPSNADYMKIKFLSTGSAGGYGTTLWFNGAQLTGNYWSGFLKFQIATDGIAETLAGIGDPDDTGSQWEWLDGKQVESFCVDIYETAVGGWRTLEIKPLSDLPISYDGTGIARPMGDNRAELISALYMKAYQTDGWTSDEASAFQIAIWEFAFEGWDSSEGGHTNVIDYTKATAAEAGFDPGTWGSASVGEYGFKASKTDTIIDLAKSMMEWAWYYWMFDSEWCHNPLWGVDECGWQGPIVPIPLPAPFALAGVGLLGVFAGRRKLAQIVK